MQLKLSPRAVLRRLEGLRRDKSGSFLIEFALVLPVMVTLGMYGTELANMASVNMQVSQIAMAVADNASRLGQTDNSAVSPSITNTDIDSVMDGAIQQGTSIKFQANGRLILSSLERSSGGRQYIAWQKCRGDLSQSSSYGPKNYGLTGTAITGLGKPGKTVAADANSAVMFAEAFYSYKPLFGKMFVNNVQFSQEFAFVVRDDRNLAPGVTGANGRSEC